MGNVTKVVFLGQSGPFSAPALRGLLRAKSSNFEIAAVVQGVRHPIQGAQHAWFRPTRVWPRRIISGQNLRDLAVGARIPTLVTADVNAAYVREELEKLEPDLLVCVGFHCLFSEALLKVPKLFALNVHPSCLPKWRGPSPIFWMLRAGEDKLGVTIHCLDAGEDSGDILWQGVCSPPALSSGGDLYRLAVEAALEPLANIIERPHLVERKPQGAREGPRARRPKPEDLEVNPREWPCQALANFIAGASYFGPTVLKMYGDAYPVKAVQRMEVGEDLPGDWLEVDDILGVRCRDGTLWLVPGGG